MTKNITFAKALARLEEIVSKLETEELGLEEATDLAAEGLSLHKVCEEKLKESKGKIDKILKEGEK